MLRSKQQKEWSTQQYTLGWIIMWRCIFNPNSKAFECSLSACTILITTKHHEKLFFLIFWWIRKSQEIFDLQTTFSWRNSLLKKVRIHCAPEHIGLIGNIWISWDFVLGLSGWVSDHCTGLIVWVVSNWLPIHMLICL